MRRRESLACLKVLSLISPAAVAREHASTLHDAFSNSWSDTFRVQGPTGREGGVPKVGFPVRPKICVLSQRWERGVIFRPAGGVRGARCRFTSQ